MKITKIITGLFLIFLLSTPQAFALRGSSAIRDEISAELDKLQGLGRYEIDIDARHGVVTLSGQVASPAVKNTIGQIASNTKGVTNVVNDLQINPAFAPREPRVEGRAMYKTIPTDGDISRRVESALQAESGISLRGLEISSRNGVVTLSGAQPSFRDIDRILSIALMVDGVKDVQSRMTIQGREYMDSQDWNKIRSKN